MTSVEEYNEQIGDEISELEKLIDKIEKSEG